VVYYIKTAATGQQMNTPFNRPLQTDQVTIVNVYQWRYWWCCRCALLSTTNLLTCCSGCQNQMPDLSG